MKPFVKWAGGKTQLLDWLNVLSFDYERIIEPFVGGGAFFLFKKPNSAIINDVNVELIKSYKVIKNQPKKLIKLLSEYENNNSKNFYYQVRSKNINEIESDLEIAARFIYLNKACFNGIYRVNSKNLFNVPYNYKEKLSIYNKENILSLNKYFKNNKIKFLNKSYEKIFRNLKIGDLVFIDPPYDVNGEKGFTSYQKDNFDKNEQKKLADSINILNKKGIKFIFTNHNTKLINQLYNKYNKIVVNTNRMINSNGGFRFNATEEVIIYNFELNPEQRKEIDFLFLLNSMHSTNIKIDKLVDWKKILDNTLYSKEELKKLNILFSKNKKELDYKIENLYNEDYKIFSLLPSLVALRDRKISLYNLNSNLVNFDFSGHFLLENVKEFIYGTKLYYIFLNKNFSNLLDIYAGIEIGLDTNARKNRSGKVYESMIENLLKKYNVNYEKQAKLKDIFKNKNKKVDFLLNINNKKYIVEVNFYNSSGSKLNEICNSYVEINNISKEKGYEFIWITDGRGWNNTKNDLFESFKKIKYLFNYNLFEKWLRKINEYKN